ncbi:NAD+ synthase [Haloplanus halobius]|uniref:NAD+ synthase n=1 Tax=Haloplanus halobius TaxID=2934938 RepID=UPI002010A889|nr:NAD+ synthase [Haloplanus sp. XH21]
MADIDVAAAVETMSDFLASYLTQAGAEGYVLGVSGGLDSTVALALAVDAVGADRVMGLVMPGDPSADRHMRDARQACVTRDVPVIELDIAPTVDAVRASAGFAPETVALGNVRARTRMVFEYLFANQCAGLVLGAANKSEHSLGYFTKYGDGAVDVAPMGELYKTEVADVARHLDVDERFVEKTPTAELWKGQTDEGELGATYDTIDDILKRLLERDHAPERIAAETAYDREMIDRFVTMHERSQHKRSRPPTADIDR